jgi:hypothetical protein
VTDVLNIVVEDEGKGMSEQQLENYFRQFEDILDEDDNGNQAANMTGSIPSIGLGLAVVARYVRNCHSQMKIKTKEGAGTKISLELPLRLASETLFEEPLLTPPTDDTQDTSCMRPPTIQQTSFSSSRSRDTFLLSRGAGSSTVMTPFSTTESTSSMELDSYPFPQASPTDKVPLRILVAEDNPLNAKILQMQLTKMGHEVILVGDGQACFDQFKASTLCFDVILMDFQVHSPLFTFSLNSNLSQTTDPF